MTSYNGKVGGASYVSLKIPGLSDEDLSRFVCSAKMKTNHGRYTVQIDMVNSFLDILNPLALKYLEIGRTNPVQGIVKFQSSVIGEHPDTSTRDVQFYIKAIRSFGDKSKETIRIYGSDPYSWFMNINRPIGTAYEGSISEVIRQVVSEVAPRLALNIVETTDDKLGIWYTNRLSPMKFVDQLISIATIATKSMTPWVLSINGEGITMQDEGSVQSREVGYYSIGSIGSAKDVLAWDVIANGSQSNCSMAITTSGIDARIGTLYDNITIMDSTTENKRYPDITDDAGFTNPKSRYKEGLYGYSYVEALPDPLFGNHTIPYSDYVKINAINEYHKRMKELNGATIKINGHGTYDNTVVAGVDVIFVEALTNNGNRHQLHGNWIVDEFEHNSSIKGDDDSDGRWTTDLTIYRMDKNSDGEAVSFG